MRALLVILSAFVFSIALHAASGDVSIFVIKDGKPLAKTKIQIDGKIELITDKDGAAFSKLSVGKHQAVIDVKEEGKSIAYAKHHFVIAPEQNTEVILTLTETGKLANIDVEASEETAKYADSNGTFIEDKRPKGRFKGVIVSSEDKKPISGARLFVKGSTSQAISNEKGAFELSVAEGNSTISVIHNKYTVKNIKIEIAANKTVTKKIELSPAGMELEEFVVLKPSVEGSIASSIAEVRNSDTVGDVLGSEQFSKSGDSSAAAALKRVSGITIVGGKYVFIRGLGERYSTILFNDLYIPSPEPTKRVVPLDIFPTSVIGSMKIQKGYSTDIPGSFGGGAVLIRSKDIPEEGYFEADVSIKSSSKTGRQVTTSSDNSKGLPDAILTASENFATIDGYNTALTREIVNYRRYDTETKTLLPSFGISLAAGNSIRFKNSWDLGFTASLFYDHEEDVNDQLTTKYNIIPVYAISQTASQVVNYSNKVGTFLTLALDTNSHSKAKYTMLYLYDTSDTTVSGNTTLTNPEESSTYYEYVQKQLFINQVNSEHKLSFANSTDKWLDDMIIKLSGEYALATRLEPGTVTYGYNNFSSNLYLDQNIYYLYSNLFDSVINARADFELPFTLNDQKNMTKFGVFFYSKSRDFDGRRFLLKHLLGATSTQVQTDIDSVLTDANAQNMTKLKFTSNYKATDSYLANQNVVAGYLSQSLSPMKSLDLIAGARFESSNQQLIQVKDNLAYDPLVTSNLLPALGATYRISDSLQFRAGYSTTLSRPDFREFSESEYTDPITGDTVIGYAGLKATTIDNIDMKLEWYLSDIESVSIGLFTKTFTNPIEQINKKDLNSDIGADIVSYRNATSATSQGVEIDLQKRFGFLGAWGENLLFSTNFSVISSKIVLNTDANDVLLSNLTTSNRAMQGQSPYVFNMQLGYDNTETGSSALFLFNQIGERIVAIGSYGLPDQYEQPFAKLDFVSKFKLGSFWGSDFALKMKASNILDSTVQIKQGADVAKSYKPGVYYSLSLTLKY